jgi:hypothetical protein
MVVGTISFAVVLVALLGVWLSHRLAVDRDASKAQKEARDKFRTVLEPIVLAIRQKRRDTHVVVSAERANLDAAIAAFRPHLKSREVASFNAYADEYAAAAQDVQPGMLTFYAAQATGKSDGPDREKRLLASLEKLLHFAR